MREGGLLRSAVALDSGDVSIAVNGAHECALTGMIGFDAEVCKAALQTKSAASTELSSREAQAVAL